MKIREHPQIVNWPPTPGGTNDNYPRAESQPILREVHISSVVDESVPLTCEFGGRNFTYDVMTTDQEFARKLAAEFSMHVGETLQQLGDLDIDF